MKLYPEISPYKSGFLDTDDGHSLYWERSGNPNGNAVVFLHGGPGSGHSPWQRRLFDPEKYDIILYDQRGAGQSKPHASLKNNTTAHLISDLDKLRNHLGIEHWHMAGGSWGATLALCYTAQHADKLKSLTLYSCFLPRTDDLKHIFSKNGVAAHFYPDAYADFLSRLPENCKENVLDGYAAQFRCPEEDKNFLEALRSWTTYERRIGALIEDTEKTRGILNDLDYLKAHGLIEHHYFINNGFIDSDELLKSLLSTGLSIPIHILHGRYDMICPIKTAEDVHRSLPGSQLSLVEGCGHTAMDRPLMEKLLAIFENL